MSEAKKYYVTKYALSARRIEERMLSPGRHPGSTHLYEGDSFLSFVAGRDAFENRDDAVKAADAARVKKIASLKKQIAKLEKLQF